MNSFSLTQYLTSNLQVSEAEINSIRQTCNTKFYKKDEFVLRANEYCQYSFFVEQGLLKQYYIDDKGKEHILQFAAEGWIVTDRESVYFNRPAQYFIQAIENTKVSLINDELIKKLEQEIPSFRDFNNRLLHHHISALQSRIVLLLGHSAEDRYLHFIKTYPDILLRVPQTLVASYLGITPESLSRVRKDLATRNFKKITS